MTTCTDCGSDVPSNVNFCAKCGTRSSVAPRRVGGPLIVVTGCVALLALGLISAMVSASKEPDRPVALSVQAAKVGDTVGASKPGICMNTERGFDEMTKWAALHDSDEISRAVIRYGGAFLNQGDSVKILDTGFFKRRVRIVTTGRECWVVSELVDR